MGAFAATGSAGRVHPWRHWERRLRRIMIHDAMADVPQSGGSGGAVPGDLRYLRYLCHELRQPLVVAVGYVSMLQEGAFGELPAEASTILRTVAERLDAVNAIIDGIADGSMRIPRE
jgi:signal transduction histidine kinase